MSGFTCISCKVLFSDPELQREHYKSDWHRYNLKRKVADLPAVTKEEYEERVLACQATTDDKNKESSKCDLCHKYFSTKNAMASHLNSKRHQELLAVKLSGNSEKKNLRKLRNKTKRPNRRTPASSGEYHGTNSIGAVEEDCDEDCDEEMSGDDEGWESFDEDDEISEPIDCLFCCEVSDTLDSNVAHMSIAHSFFIPDIEYLTNLKGLIVYLNEKVRDGHLCLWCNDKGKAFKSINAAQQHMIDKGHCKMLHEAEEMLEYESFYDYSSSYSDTTAENGAEYVSVDVLDDSGYELVLPSGAVIGHRSLAIYYNQNIRPQTPGNENRIKKIMQRYQALGWTGTTGSAAVKKARDLSYMKKIQSKRMMQLGVKHNKFQPHFRQQVMF